MTNPKPTHITSTLAVTAIILGGLLAASPFPYPRAPEARPQRVVHAVAPDLETAANVWTDPPARVAVVGASPAVVRTADVAADTVPDLQAPVAAVETSVPAPAVANKSAERASAKLAAKRAELAKRRKMAQAASRDRQASQKQAAVNPVEPEAASTAPAARPVDPIGDLLRGLGIGRQG